MVESERVALAGLREVGLVQRVKPGWACAQSPVVWVEGVSWKCRDSGRERSLRREWDLRGGSSCRSRPRWGGSGFGGRCRPRGLREGLMWPTGKRGSCLPCYAGPGLR